MRTRLLPLLIVLMAGVLLALGFPLAASLAASEQQRVVVDRLDDAARFAALAQFVSETSPGTDERSATLGGELASYHDVYGIRAGIFYRNNRSMAAAPEDWVVPYDGEGRRAFNEALLGRRSHNPPQVWPWQTHARLIIASPVVRDGDVVAVVVTDSPTGQLRMRILRGWVLIFAGEAAAMLVAVGAAFHDEDGGFGEGRADRGRVGEAPGLFGLVGADEDEVGPAGEFQEDGSRGGGAVAPESGAAVDVEGDEGAAGPGRGEGAHEGEAVVGEGGGDAGEVEDAGAGDGLVRHGRG